MFALLSAGVFYISFDFAYTKIYCLCTIMKNTFKFCFLGCICLLGAQAWASPLSYTITKNVYLFSTYLELDGNDSYEGRVIKNHLSIRTIYDLYGRNGEYEAQGVCQILSLGALFPWAKDIDVYDANGNRIGFIDGQLLTTTAAKYSFYNQSNEIVANAYLDWNCSAFTIMTPNEKIVARLKRSFVLEDIDSWKVVAYDSELLDLRIIKVFSSFVIDSQGYFKEDH